MKLIGLQKHPGQTRGQEFADGAFSRTGDPHEEKYHSWGPKIGLEARKSGAPSFAHSAGQVQQSFANWSTLRALAAGCKMDLRRDTSGKTLSIAKTAAKKAGLLYFVFVMFAYTTGGPFGMEEMVTTSGPGVTML